MMQVFKNILILYCLSISVSILSNDLYNRNNGWDVDPVIISNQSQYDSEFENLFLNVEDTWNLLLPYFTVGTPESNPDYLKTNPTAAAAFNLSTSTVLSTFKQSIGKLQALYLKRNSFGTAEQNQPIPVANATPDIMTILTDIGYKNSFIRFLTIYKYYLVLVINQSPSYASYSTDLKTSIATCATILSYMFNNKTAAEVAAIDAANAAQNAQTSQQQAIADITNFFSPTLKMATTEQLLAIYATFNVVDSAGNITPRTGYLTLDSTGSLWCDQNARYARASFFNIEVATKNNAIRLKSPLFGGKYLADVSKDSIGASWTFDYKKRASRITATVAYIDPSSQATEFVFKNTSTSSTKSFQLQSLISAGFWVIESDWCMRSFKTTLESYTVGADFVIEPVTPFHLDMADALALTDAKRKIIAFKNIAMDPLKIKSEDDLKNFILSLKNILEQSLTVPDDWYQYYASLNDILSMLIYLRKSFYNSWNSTALDIKSLLITQLGPISINNIAPKSLTDDQHTTILKNAELLKKNLYDKEVLFKDSRFNALSYSSKVNDLLTRLPDLTASTIGKFMSDLEAVTSISNSGTVSSSDAIVDAFPDDFKNINSIITNLKWSAAFLQADADPTTQGSFTRRLNNINNALNITIPVETYLTRLDNFIKSKTIFTLEDKNFFKASLQRIVNARGTAANVVTCVNSLITILNRVINNQMRDMASELNVVLSSLTGELASTEALRNYSDRIEKDIKALVQSPTFSTNSVKTLLNNLQGLVDDRVDASKADIQNLYTYLTTKTDNQILLNQILPFYDNGNALKQINVLAQNLLQPVDFSKRASNLRAFVQNNPAANFIDAGGNLKTTIDINKVLILPLLDKLELLINSKSTATQEDKDSVINTIEFVTKNQLKLSLNQIVSNTTSMFAGKTINDAMQQAKSIILGQQSYDQLSFSKKIEFLATLLQQTTDPTFNPTDFCDKVVEISSNKIMLTPSDIEMFKSILNESVWKPIFGGSFLYKTKTYKIFATNIMNDLDIAPSIDDVKNMLLSYANSNDTLNQEEQIFFINKANILMTMQTSIDNSNANVLADIINKVKFNKLSPENRSGLDSILALLTQQSTISSQTIANKIKSLTDKVKSLSTLVSSDARTLGLNIVQVNIPDLLNNYLIDATQEDLTQLSILFDLIKWNTVLSQNTMSYTIPNSSPSIVSQKIAIVVDTYFKSFLTKTWTFQDILNSLQRLSLNVPLNQTDQISFLARAKKLSTLANQGEVNPLQSAITLLQQAKFNYMSSYAKDIDDILNQLNTALTDKTGTLDANISLPDFITIWNNFTTAFNTISDSTLQSLKTLLQAVVDNKLYAKKADWNQAVLFFQDPSFLTNSVIQWKGGLTLLKPLIDTFSTPIQFSDDYRALKDLVKRCLADNKALSLYLQDVLKEKLGLLASSGGAAYTNKIDLQDITLLIQSVKQISTLRAISITGVFDSLDDLLAKVKVGMRNQENFNLTFSQRVNIVKTMATTITNTDSATNFYEYILSLAGNQRVEAAIQDITNLINIIKTAYYSTNLVNLLNQNNSNKNAADLIQDVINKLNTSVTNLNRVEWLLNILASPTLASHHPDLIMSTLDYFYTNAQTDTTGNNKLGDLLIACDKAQYLTMANRRDLVTMIDKLKSLSDQIGASLSNQDIATLQNAFTTLPNTLADIRLFLDKALSITNKRFDISATDLTTLINLLTGLQFKSAYTSNQNNTIATNSPITIKQQVSNLLTTLQQPVTFTDLLQNLINFYNTNNKADFSDDNKQIFLNKLDRLLSLQNSNLVRQADTDDDKIFVLINFLNQAAYNQMASAQASLLPIVQNLITFRKKTQATMPATYSYRVNALSSKIAALSGINDVQDLIQYCQDLYKDREQGTSVVINTLKSILLDDLGPIATNKIIFNSGMLPQFRTIGNSLNDPISVADRYAELQRMIKEIGSFSQTDKEEFFTKLKDLVNLKTNFAAANFDKQQLLDLIAISKVNIYTSSDTFIDPDTKTSKNFYTELNAQKSILDTYVSTGTTEQTFAQKLDSLKKSLTTVSDTTSAKAFISSAQLLIDQRIDATKQDLNDFSSFLSSDLISTNEYLYSAFGNFYFIQQLQKDMQKPILLNDRITNLTAFITKNKTFTADQKLLLVQKAALIFEERGKAKAENINLVDVQTLLQLVIKNRYDPKIAADQTSISTLNSFATNILTPPTQNLLKDNMVYDFSIDIDNLKKSFATLTFDNYSDFINQINDVATRRVNAVYDDNVKADQAQYLYNWLNSEAVLLNEVVYTNDNQSILKKAASGILTIVPYADAFQNLQNYVKANATFDLNLASLFKKKLQKLVDLKSQAKKENFNLSLLIELIEFTKQNRFISDFASQKVLDGFITSLKSNTSTTITTFGDDFLTLQKTYFGGTITDFSKPVSLTFTDTNNVAAFVESINSLLQKKADSTATELTNLLSLLGQTSVMNNKDLFRNQDLRLKLNAIIDKLNVPLTFADLANNLVEMLNNNDTFSDPAKLRFKTKLQRVVNMRTEGYSSNYDMATLAQWINFSLANQMLNDPEVSTLYTTFLVKPSGTSTVAPFVSYASKVTKAKTDLSSLGNTTTNTTKATAWVQGLQDLINSRIDGMLFNTITNQDDLSIIADFVNYLDNTARYNVFIYNTPLEQTINSYIQTLNQKPTFTELVNNIKALSNINNYFSIDHRDLFVNQLQRIIFRKNEANQSQIDELSRTINFTAVNKFITQADGSFLVTYINALKGTGSPTSPTSATDLANLTTDVAAMESFINSITSTNVASITQETRETWFNKVKACSFKAIAQTGQIVGPVGKVYIDLATRIKDAASSLRNRIFVGTDLVAETNSKVITPMNTIIARV